jgi:hypothetical protein
MHFMKRPNPLLQSISGKAKGLFFSLTFLTLLGCVTPTSGGGRMQVELDAFSGRPNPHWDLTSQEAKEFISRFQALPQQQGKSSFEEGLGYRGLMVTQPNEDIEGYNEIQIANGLVVAKQNSQSKQFTDHNRSLERWLFQTGKGRLDEALYKQISQQNMSGERVEHIIVTIDNKYLPKIQSVVTALQSAGMKVGNVLPGSGIITGEVSQPKIQGLKSVPGVVDVEVDQKMQTQ